MTFEQAEEFLEESRAFGSVPGLANMEFLMNKLDHVQDKLKVIHVAGTNGKGSVCVFLSSVLCEAGYRVGQFNSPAVFTELEIIRMNGENISREDFAFEIEKISAITKEMLGEGRPHPTIFEVETAAAFSFFKRKECDYVVLETGMGGTLDATNIVKQPLLAVFTSISMDHMDYLGDSLEKIAENKAGIMKPGCQAVSASQNQIAGNVLKHAAEKNGTDISFAEEMAESEVTWNASGITYQYGKIGKITIGMGAIYQLTNSLCALKAIEALKKTGIRISDEAVKRGMYRAVWPGRFEKINANPLLIVDGAHNEEAAELLAQSMGKYFPNKKFIYIMGVLKDKDYDAMLKIMLQGTNLVFTVTPPNPRALEGRKLAENIQGFGTEAIAVQSAKEALRKSFITMKSKESSYEGILAWGSLSYLKNVKKAYKELMEEGQEFYDKKDSL